MLTYFIANYFTAAINAPAAQQTVIYYIKVLPVVKVIFWGWYRCIQMFIWCDKDNTAHRKLQNQLCFARFVVAQREADKMLMLPIIQCGVFLQAIICKVTSANRPGFGLKFCRWLFLVFFVSWVLVSDVGCSISILKSGFLISD